jgi:hypothetical protein
MFVQVRQIARFLCNNPLTRDHRAAGFARLCRWQIASRLAQSARLLGVGVQAHMRECERVAGRSIVAESLHTLCRKVFYRELAAETIKQGNLRA